MAKATQLERREEWRQRVAAFKASGKSGVAWCAEHGIRPHQLYYWVQRLASSAETGSERLPHTPWVPVEVEDHRPSSEGKGLELRIGSVAVEVHPGFDEKLLRDVVRVLSAIC
jgi:transposase-like protein